MQPPHTGWNVFAPDPLTGTPPFRLPQNGPADVTSAGRGSNRCAHPVSGGRSSYHHQHRTACARVAHICQLTTGSSGAGVIPDLFSQKDPDSRARTRRPCQVPAGAGYGSGRKGHMPGTTPHAHVPDNERGACQGR